MRRKEISIMLILAAVCAGSETSAQTLILKVRDSNGNAVASTVVSVTATVKYTSENDGSLVTKEILKNGITDEEGVASINFNKKNGYFMGKATIQTGSGILSKTQTRETFLSNSVTEYTFRRE